MNKIVLTLLISIFLTNFGLTASSKLNEDDNELRKLRKHSVGLHFMYLNQKNGGVEVTSGPFSVTTNIGGMGAKFLYSYYPNYSYAFYMSIGASSPEVKVNDFSNYTSSIVTFKMGMRYFFINDQSELFFRPYITGGMVMLVGTESEVDILNVGTHTESAMGATAGFGAELLLSSRFKVNTEIGYNFVSDFVEQIGKEKNYSGMEFSFGLGFMF